MSKKKDALLSFIQDYQNLPKLWDQQRHFFSSNNCTVVYCFAAQANCTVKLSVTVYSIIQFIFHLLLFTTQCCVRLARGNFAHYHRFYIPYPLERCVEFAAALVARFSSVLPSQSFPDLIQKSLFLHQLVFFFCNSSTTEYKSGWFLPIQA